MGVTIHYQGRLTDPQQLPQLIAAVQHTCRKLRWPFIDVDERIIGTAEVLVYHPSGIAEDQRWVSENRPVDDRWRGVIVMPPGSESLWLTFNRSGRMIVYDANATSFAEPGHYLAREQLFTMTQFSSAETHIALCSLLRITEHYGAELDVDDEGGYWETEDAVTLQQRMDFIDSVLTEMEDEPYRMPDSSLDTEVEVGKAIERALPDWRRNWGISAGEN